MDKRKSLRLAEYDYSHSGAYFVTICTHGRKQILSTISVGEGLCPLPLIKLTHIGKMVQSAIEFVNDNTENIVIDKYVIMPNHIHMIVILDNGPGGGGTPPLRSVIRRIKSYTTNQYKDKLWQRSYYDHIIRDEADYLEKRNYIDTNPQRWAEDEYY